MTPQSFLVHNYVTRPIRRLKTLPYPRRLWFCSSLLSGPLIYRCPPGHPLAWLQEDYEHEPMTEARRRELVELGFEDDGYDYLKHMRVLGQGNASIEGLPAGAAAAAAKSEEASAMGPSVFVKAATIHAPEEDVALFDASALTVMTAAEEEQEAEGLMGGVTAFSKKKQVVKGTEQRELEELEAVMKALEDSDAEEALDEETLLLDDFVVAATSAPAPAEGEEPGHHHAFESGSDVESYDDEDEEGGSDWSSDEEGGVGGPGRKVPPRPGSIASTYWRAERTDRRNLLTVVDERFEHLALEYDETELDLADLDEELPDDARGVADVHDFENLLDEFLEQRGRSDTAHETGVPYHAPQISSTIRAELEANGMDDSDAAIAILRAREAIHRAEEEDDSVQGKTDLESVTYFTAPREKWDIESMASLRSNLYNHPGTITEPGTRKGAASPGMIRLNKDGIPMGVLPPRFVSAKQEAIDEEEDDEDDSDEDEMRVLSIPERKKGETAEEKKARKNAVKQAKKEARVAKKELKTLYKDEANKAKKRAATAQVQPTLVL